VPFTGSHPAAVLPLLRAPLVPSALVIGSMSPDLLYYLGLPDPVRWRLSELSHSPLGVVGFDPLCGLAAFLLWQVLLAPLAVAVAPVALCARLGPGLPVPPRRHLAGIRPMLLVLTSLVIGAATHVLWDEFTHAGGWGVQQIGWLTARHGWFPGYYWAQLGSSVIGLVLIGLTLLRWWRRSEPESFEVPRPTARPAPAVRRAVLGTVAACTMTGAVVGVWGAVGDGLGNGSLPFLVSVYAGGAGLVASLVCAVLLRAGWLRDRSRSSVGSDGRI